MARAILAGDLSGLAAAGLTAAGVREVRAHTLTDNMPSRRVLEKAGFTYVGPTKARLSTCAQLRSNDHV
jgi:RimJ/RimL family protein N-acetyltransferase